MALNFPSNPAVGAIHAEAGKQYKWSGYAWLVVAATETYGPVFISDTPPPNALGGDLWYESDTGKLYVYYCDIDSKQFVQVGGSSDLNTADFLPLSGGTLSGTVSFGNTLATNLADPIAAQDAATKNYVDSQIPDTVSTFVGSLPVAASDAAASLLGVAVGQMYAVSPATLSSHIRVRLT